MDKRYRYDGQYGQTGAVHLVLGVLQVMQMGTEAVGSLIVVHHLGPVSYLTMLTVSKSLGVTSHGGFLRDFPAQRNIVRQKVNT